MKPFLAALLSMAALQIEAAPFWSCWPNNLIAGETRFLVEPGEQPGTAILHTQSSLVRESGTLPAGSYPAAFRKTPSGYSWSLSVEVGHFFPNTLPQAEGSFLTFMLPVKAPLFAAELYLQFPAKGDPYVAEIISFFSCRRYG